MVSSRFFWRMLSATLSLTLNTLSGKPHNALQYSLIHPHGSKTVTALDVVYALKRSGRTLYGFGA